MQTSGTSSRSEDRHNSGQEAHPGNDTQCQAWNYLQVIVKGADLKDVEIRNSGKFVRPEGDVLMVTCFAEGLSAEERVELSLTMGVSLEQRASREEQQDKTK